MRRAQRVGRAKVLMAVIVIGIPMMGWIPSKVRAEEHYYVSGYVITGDGNGTTAYLGLSCKNLRTNEIQNIETDENGYYVLDATQFQQGLLEGDLIEITPDEKEGYYSIPKLVAFDDRAFLYHYINCDITLPPKPPEPWSDIVVVMHVTNRQINNCVKWNRQSNTRIDVPQEGGSIMIRMFYSCWDDGYSNFPEQDATYIVTIKHYFKIHQDDKDDEGNYPWYYPLVNNQDGPFTIEYVTYWGDEITQIDPIVTIDLPNSADEKRLTIYAKIEFNLKDYNTNEIIDSWSVNDNIHNIRYDWP